MFVLDRAPSHDLPLHRSCELKSHKQVRGPLDISLNNVVEEYFAFAAACAILEIERVLE